MCVCVVAYPSSPARVLLVSFLESPKFPRSAVGQVFACFVFGDFGHLSN